jgi:hypothetical protein
VKTTPDAVPLQDVEGLYRRYKTIWDDLSLQWLEHRRRAGSGEG